MLCSGGRAGGPWRNCAGKVTRAGMAFMQFTTIIASFPGLPQFFLLQAIKVGDKARDEATTINHASF